MAEAKFQVWIDQDLCTGDGICTEIAPELFDMGDESQGHSPYLAYVHEDGKQKKMTDAVGVPDDLLEAAIESAEECPGECIFIEEKTF